MRFRIWRRRDDQGVRRRIQRNIGRYQDLALTEAVAVTRNGRQRTVLISVDEYQRLKRRDRQVLSLRDFTAEDIAALETTGTRTRRRLSTMS
jgi:PHD/YefM family antitoxin component YafN of YafNO toxin-antitoxin module